MTLGEMIGKVRRALAGDVREAVYRGLIGPSRAVDLGLALPIENDRRPREGPPSHKG